MQECVGVGSRRVQLDAARADRRQKVRIVVRAGLVSTPMVGSACALSGLIVRSGNVATPGGAQKTRPEGRLEGVDCGSEALVQARAGTLSRHSAVGQAARGGAVALPRVQEHGVCRVDR
jgi:hypothetical protein